MEKCHVGNTNAKQSKVQEVGKSQLAQDTLYERSASLVNPSNLKQSYVVHLVPQGIY
jgi:hypothetical protein